MSLEGPKSASRSSNAVSVQFLRRVECVCDKFECEWRRGSPPEFADYVQGFEGAERSWLLRELLRLELAYRERRGDEPQPEEYRGRLSEDGELVETVFRQRGQPQAPSVPGVQPQVLEETAVSADSPTARAADASAVGQVGMYGFVQSLCESGLMTAQEVAAVLDCVPSAKRPETAHDLVQLLYRCGKLTKFQSREDAGKPQLCVLGNYVLLDIISSGGMGRVYKAIHRRMNRQVALKLLPSTLAEHEEAIQRFQREAEASAKLSHPNIVAVYDADEVDGVHFLVMEYIEGMDLVGIVNRYGPLPVAEAVDYILQAARGLEFAHALGVIHRDLKPSNMILDNSRTVKILDFGLARLVQSERTDIAPAEDTITQADQMMGTIEFMAPEQAEDARRANHRSDIYSLGCTLFYLLTGRNVYAGETMVRKLVAHREAPIPSLRAVLPENTNRLDALFPKMLSKNPADRCADVREVIHELEAVVKELPESSERENRAGKAELSKPRLRTRLQRTAQHKWVRGLFVLGLMSLGWLAGVLYTMSRRAPTEVPHPPERRHQTENEPFRTVASVHQVFNKESATKNSGRVSMPRDGGSPTTGVMWMQQNAASPIDLLRLVDCQRDTISGAWSFENGSLSCAGITDARNGQLTIPYRLPREYDLEIVAQRKPESRGPGGLGIIAFIEDQPVTAYLDGYLGSGLMQIDGKSYSENSTYYSRSAHGELFVQNVDASIVCAVRSSSITVSHNGKQIIHWHGDPKQQLSMPWDWGPVVRRQLILGSHGASFEFKKCTIEAINPAINP